MGSSLVFLVSVVFIQMQIPPAWPEKVLEPRYDMCAEFRPHSVEMPHGRELSAFAASAVPGVNMTATLKLRVALLIEGTGSWILRNTRYGKCTSELLSKHTLIRCRARGVAKTWSEWINGTLAQFQNTEVHHDFIHCDLMQTTPDASMLSVQVSLHEPEDEFPLLLQLELCRIEEPLLDVVFCTQPLFGFQRLAQEFPFIIDDWLAYHLAHIGLEHASIYDVDGSFEHVLEPWLRNSSFKLTYFKRWPSLLSDSMERISEQYPYCSESWAYAHCLTSQRSRSRWVMLLHAPDEYIRPPHEGKGALLELILNFVEKSRGPTSSVQVMRMQLLDFAHGGQAAAPKTKDRGSVLEASCQRADQGNTFVLIADPREVVCSGPHTVFTEAGTPDSGAAIDLEQRHLVVHHYVEMLESDLGRCRQYHSSCNIPDTSILWVVDLLRAGGLGIEKADMLTCASTPRESADRSEKFEGADDATGARDCFTSTEHFRTCCCENFGADCQPGQSSFISCCGHLLEYCQGDEGHANA